MKTYITPEDIEAVIAAEAYHVIPGTTVTVCNLVLKNGFSVQGVSACVDPLRYNRQDGETYSREDAVSKVWPLEGYLLKQRMFEIEVKNAEDTNG